MRDSSSKDRDAAVHGRAHHKRWGVGKDVAGAHQKDLETQGAYGVDYKRYWVDEEVGKIFCLVQADRAEDAVRVRREAHGLVADDISAVGEYS